MWRFTLLAAGAWMACESPADRPAEWGYLHPAVIEPSCATASCHSELSAAADLRLDDEAIAYAQLLDRQYVMPGDSESPLLYLLEGDERERMPPDAPLPRADIDLVRRWIEEGAVP
jgi:cytochrome c